MENSRSPIQKSKRPDMFIPHKSVHCDGFCPTLWAFSTGTIRPKPQDGLWPFSQARTQQMTGHKTFFFFLFCYYFLNIYSFFSLTFLPVLFRFICLRLTIPAQTYRGLVKQIKIQQSIKKKAKSLAKMNAVNLGGMRVLHWGITLHRLYRCRKWIDNTMPKRSSGIVIML